MKLLTLVRHAKSSWSDPSLDDFDRPLNKRGKTDAPKIGKILARSGVIPDSMISSPALRAFTTAKVIAQNLGYAATDIQADETIYGADVDELITVIHKLDDRNDHVYLFGHNPGFQDLANILTNRTIEKLVTCGVVKIKFEVDSWKKVEPGTGKLIEYIYPKMFK